MKKQIAKRNLALAMVGAILVSTFAPINASALSAEGRNYVHYLSGGSTFTGSLKVDPEVTETDTEISVVMMTPNVYFVDGGGATMTTLDYQFTTNKEESVPFKLDLSKVSRDTKEVKVQVLMPNHSPIEVTILNLASENFSVVAPNKVKVARAGDEVTLPNIVVRGVNDVATVKVLNYDSRDLTLEDDGTNSSRGNDVIISGVEISATKNASDTGYLYIEADGKKERVAVADIVNDEVVVSLDEKPDYKNKEYIATILFSAPSTNTFISGRDVDITLKGAEFKKLTGSGIDADISTRDKEEAVISFDGSRKEYKLEVEFVPERNAKEITLTIEDNRAGIEEKVIDLGEPTSKIDVSVEKVDIKPGLRGQAVPNIVLTEGQDGTLDEGDHRIYLDNYRGVDFENGPSIKVVEGNIDIDKDLEVGTDSNGRSYIEFSVRDRSTRASKIEISDVKVTVSNMIAEGVYSIYLKEDGKDMPKNGIPYVNVTSVVAPEPTPEPTPEPAKPELPKAVYFKIGEGSFFVDGVQKTMDANAQIHNSRTMVPMRYAAEAFGATVDWNDAARTATIKLGDKTVVISLDSNVMFSGQEPIIMDTKPVVVEGRTLLPVAYIAKALGLDAQWDEATQIVKIVPAVQAPVVVPTVPTVPTTPVPVIDQAAPVITNIQ